MDIYTTSFIVPSLSASSHSSNPSVEFSSSTDPYALNHGLTDSHLNSQAIHADTEAVQMVVMKAMQAHACHITFSRFEHAKCWNFYISGPYQQVMAARGTILRECPIQHRASVKVTRSEILDLLSPNPVVRPDVRRRLDEIADHTKTRITVVNGPLATSDGISSNGGWSGLENERACEITIVGSGADLVDVARVRLLIMLDEMSGLHADFFEIDCKLHAIIAGRRRCVIQSIQEETATNIYFPSPLQGLVGPEVGSMAIVPPSVGGVRRSSDVIWITGEFFGVQRARDMLYQLAAHKTNNNIITSRDTAILPRKLDWMLTDRSDDLKTIMNDNATFIHFPPIGSLTSLITIYGDDKVNIQRTIRSIMQLACSFYVASLWLLPVQFNVLLPPTNLNPAQMAPVLQQISVLSGAEVVFKTNCFEMHGLEQQVRTAVMNALELDVVQNFQHEIRFQLELANEHREFISGKKNGKINKIMQTTSVKIKFETFNEYNFLIDLAGQDRMAIQGLTLLQEELPAEISFHVPESYHKRIIGVGGKSIQRIMKRFGVYVKFSNAEEFAALGGYVDNEDNVVARTPAKNAINLENLKQAVMELVNPKDKDYMYEKITIPRKYHRSLAEKHIFLRNIESKTASKIRFPDKELASDVISIFGPESQVHIAATMLQDQVPFEAEMAIPPNKDLPRLCASQEFLVFGESLKRDFEVTIVPSIKVSPNGSPSGSPRQCLFKFMCQRSNSDCLTTARELFEEFLVSNHIPVYPSARTHKRADSFAEAFPHFDSKLLSAARAPSDGPDRTLKLASSSPDMKALFNNSAYNYEQDDTSSTRSAYDTETPTDHWTPLPFIGPPPTVHNRHEDALKRGSDSLLEAKLKEKFAKSRSNQNRAHSLDLGLSLSRITEGSGPVPESPTNSNFDEASSSSPPSATALSFPSVYGPPAGQTHVARTAVSSGNLRAGRGARILDDESVEAVSRAIAGISGLGL